MLHTRIQHNDYLKETVFPVLYALCPAQNSPFQAGSSLKLEVNPRKKKKKRKRLETAGSFLPMQADSSVCPTAHQALDHLKYQDP